MDKFQEAYREAVDKLPKFHMEADKAKDEVHHYRMLKKGRKYLITRGCTAAAVCILCGAGTVAAKNFRDSVVRISDNGFVITSENALPAEDAIEPGDDDLPDTASFLKSGGVFSTEDGIPDGAENGIEPYGEMQDVEEIDAVEEVQVEEYNSLEDFYASSDVVAAIPDSALLGREFSSERIHVMDGGRELFLYFSDEDASFSMSQADNRGYESYSSATAYMGRSCNERGITNRQGLHYVVFDTVDESGALISVHAVISVNGRDLALSFEGFDEKAVEKVLENLDLSIYYQE